MTNISQRLTYIFLIFIVVSNFVSSPHRVDSDYLRLRVIANSDCYIDQKMKLEIRDMVLDLTKDDIVNKRTKIRACEYINENLKIIDDEALKIVRSYGKDYEVKTSCGYTFFPEKTYGKQVYPSGKYDALKIEIGEAKGKNWWCVMYPPLCVIAIEDENVAADEVVYKSLILDKIKQIKQEKTDEK